MAGVLSHPRYARTQVAEATNPKPKPNLKPNPTPNANPSQGLYYLGWFNRTRLPNPELLSARCC